jgi:uncharacterized integral membrane protein
MRRHDDLDSGGLHEPDGRRRGGVPTGWIVAGVVAILLLVFALQNSERVDVDFIVFDAQVRVVVLILASAVLGFVVGWLLGRPSRAERRQMRDG